MDDYTIHLGTLLLDLFIPESQSLKTKRRILKSVKDQVHHKFNVSFSEVAELNKWQRAVCAAAMISNDKKLIDQTLQAILNLVIYSPGIQLISSKVEFL
jgi:hypothetical protein